MSFLIKKIILENFRSHEVYRLECVSKIIILTGNNGAGKTSILEAIAMTLSGRNFKTNENSSLINTKKEYLSVGVETEEDFYKLYLERNSKKKELQINDTTTLKKQLKICILTFHPESEYAFFSSVSERRDFFDKITDTFYPEHIKNINKLKYLLSERLKLLEPLKDNSKYAINNGLLKVLEKQISEISSIIAFARISICDKISQDFSYSINLEGVLENMIKQGIKALEIENNYIQILEKDRLRDAFTYQTNSGIGKTTLHFKCNDREEVNFTNFSQGEKKLMLINLIFAHARTLCKYKRINPIILLDDLFNKIDDQKTEEVINFIIDSGFQTFITVVDINKNILDKYLNHFQVIKIL